MSSSNQFLFSFAQSFIRSDTRFTGGLVTGTGAGFLVLLEISSAVEGIDEDESGSTVLCSLTVDDMAPLLPTGETGTVKTLVDREPRDLELLESSLTVSGGFTSSVGLFWCCVSNEYLIRPFNIRKRVKFLKRMWLRSRRKKRI